MTRRIVARVAKITGGIASLLLVVASPLAHLDHHLLTAHMAQHLILMLVAAPLLLAGAGSASLPQPPLVLCWFAGTCTVIFWHIPAIFELAIASHFWHGLEQATFVIAGLLFWRPVIDSASWPVPIYLFLATLPCDALSAFLAFCGHAVYQPYLSGHARMFGLSPLDDQALAGALMWVAVTFGYLIPALVLTSRLIREDRATRVRIELKPRSREVVVVTRKPSTSPR